MGALRLAFMGTPDFAVGSLRALVEAGHHVVAVYSQPPRPVGRGHKQHPSPVHAYADSQSIPVFTPTSLKSAAEQQAFQQLDLDVAVVAAYGLILPQAILDAPRMGCLNIHASLLPRWRGAAPIQRALQAGDAETGITIMQMDQGLDTGPMLLSERMALDCTVTAASLHDALAVMGAKLIVRALAEYPSLTPIAQPEQGVTYAAKLTKDEGRIDWSQPTHVLDRHIRALNPAPGVWTELGAERLKILAAEIVDDHPSTALAAPGTVLDDRLTVATGDGALRLLRLQRPGKSPMLAVDLLRGFSIPAGTRMPCGSTGPLRT